MELIKAVSRRTVISEATYITLNLALAVATLLVVLAFETPWPAFLLVVLSKWRILAVRPRFWFANIQTNLVDILVGLSAVILMWQATGALWLQIVITILFAAWLLVLKPRSRRNAMLLQAGVSQFVSIMALYSIAYIMPSFAVVFMMWIIGYASARHALTTYEEEDTTQLSLIWGYVTAALGWLAFHWTIGYALFVDTGEVQIPQIAVIMLALSYLAERVYALYRHDGHVALKNIRWPLIFISALLAVVLIFFNGFFDI